MDLLVAQRREVEGQPAELPLPPKLEGGERPAGEARVLILDLRRSVQGQGQCRQKVSRPQGAATGRATRAGQAGRLQCRAPQCRCTGTCAYAGKRSCSTGGATRLQHGWQAGASVQRTTTEVIHGIHCGMRPRSSHSANAVSSGTSHSIAALQPCNGAASRGGACVKMERE